MNSTANVLTGLLRLIDAAGGEIETRIRIQKEAFILGSMGYEHFPIDNFSYHHFGPFSRELSDCLQVAVSSGLVRETQAAGADGGCKYIYALTDKGANYLSVAGGNLEQFSRLIADLGRHHWRTLELAATSLFLEIRGEASSKDAFNKALDLKPDTKPYSDKAWTLLDELRAQS